MVLGDLPESYHLKKRSEPLKLEAKCNLERDRVFRAQGDSTQMKFRFRVGILIETEDCYRQPCTVISSCNNAFWVVVPSWHDDGTYV